MPLKIAVVCEAEADYRTATGLAELVLRTVGDWAETVLENCVLWWGLDRQGTFLCWKDVTTLARERGVRSHGHFNNEPAAPDAHAAQRALRLLHETHGELDGVLLIRDDDRQLERRQGLEQARDGSPWRERIIIGLAHCKRECWALAGFDPLDQAEQSLLQEERQRLGFDPCLAADQLRAKHDVDTRSAKRVLAVLTRENQERESFCWTTPSLGLLHERGQNTGLADYLTQINAIIVPRFLGHGAG